MCVGWGGGGGGGGGVKALSVIQSIRSHWCSNTVFIVFGP